MLTLEVTYLPFKSATPGAWCLVFGASLVPRSVGGGSCRLGLSRFAGWLGVEGTEGVGQVGRAAGSAQGSPWLGVEVTKGVGRCGRQLALAHGSP